MHTSPLCAILRCDQTQLCWLGNTDTVTSGASRTRSPPATQIIRSAGTPAASISRTDS